MPILGVSVSLYDIIENSGPLAEADIWGVLCQGAESIQDLFFRGEAIQDGGPSFVITPNTLLLCANGRTQFSQSSQVKASIYFAPEMHTGIAVSEAAIEKIYVYSLGKTLQVALEYCSKQNPTLSISRNLECILTAMCEKNPSLRIALIHVLEACSLESQKRAINRAPSFSQCVARLNKSVMGSQNELSYWNYDYYNSSSSDQSRQSTLNRRSLKSRKACHKHKRRNPYSKKDHHDRSRSQSPARHTSRSHRNVGQMESEISSNMEKISQIASNYSSVPVQPQHKTNDQLTSLGIPVSYNSPAINITSPYRPGTSTDTTSLSSSKHPPSSVNSVSDVASHLAHTPAYGKYLQLKQRQRKLQAVRHHPIEEGCLWASDTSDSYSDTRSVTSGVSVMQGSYLPDLNSVYGNDLAFKLGPRGSDQDSIISSEMSFFQHEPNSMRSEADPTLPYAAPSLKAMTEHTLGTSLYSQIPRSPSSSILSSHGDDSFLNTKESNGPEFICRGRKPLIRLNTPLVGESVKNPSHARRVIIVLLNGQKLEAICDPAMTGKQIFMALVSHMGLDDIHQSFGLTYIHDGEHFFLENDTKLHKVAPDGWREGKKGPVAITFILFFRLKYYGSSILSPTYEQLLYLQLRQDILEERFECDENRALSLAAFALQVEYGSYKKEMMGRNYFVPEYYFSKRILNLYGLGFIRDHTPEAHRSICGMSNDDAMVKFIRLVQELPEYGSHFHKVYKTKNENPTSLSWIGISSHSMIIAENLKKDRVIVERQPWELVDKLSFKGKRFTVQLKPGLSGKATKVHFYTNSHRKGRYLLQLSTDQHKFQLKMNQELGFDSQDIKSVQPPPFADIEFADAEDCGEESLSIENTEMLTATPIYEFQTETYGVPAPMCVESNPKPVAAAEDLVAAAEVPVAAAEDLVAAAEDPVAAAEDLATDNVACLHDTDSSYLVNIPPKSSSNPHLVPSPIITSPGTTTSTSVCDIDPEKGTCVSDSRDNCGAKNNNFIEVILEKDLHGSIGISLTNTNTKDSVDSGEIFVSSIQPNGPADRDGQLKCNDQILAVDGTTVMGLTCNDVNNWIRQGEHPNVKLLLCQRSQTSPVKVHSSPPSSNSDAKLPASSSCPKLSLKTHTALSSSTNDLDTTKDLKPKSSMTKSYFDHSYIPEHHVSTPNIFDSIYKTEDEFISSDPNQTASVEQPIDKPEEDSKEKCSNGIKQTTFPTRPSQVLTKKIPSMKDVLLKKAESSTNTLMPASTISQSTLNNSTDKLFTNLGTTHFVSRRHSENWTLLSKNSWNLKSRKPNEKFFDCILTKIRGSFGLNIIGGTDTKTELGGVYVKSLQPGGAAQQNGTIRKNDRILSINDVSLEERHHRQAVRILRDAPDRCIVVLGRVVEENLPATRETFTRSITTKEYGYYGHVPQTKVDTKLDLKKTKSLPNHPSTTPILTSPVYVIKDNTPQTERTAKTAEYKLNHTQEHISQKKPPGTCCHSQVTKTYYVGATTENVLKQSPTFKDECSRPSVISEEHKKCSQETIYFTDRDDGATINKTVTPKGSWKDPTLSDSRNNKLMEIPYSGTDKRLGFDDKGAYNDKSQENEKSNILEPNGYISNSPNERSQVTSDSHSALSEDIGQFSQSHEKLSVCKSKTHEATLVHTGDVCENLSESVSETNMSELINQKPSFTSDGTHQRNSDTMTAANHSSTDRTTTEQQCPTHMCELAEKSKVLQVGLKRLGSGNYGFSLVAGLNNNHSRLFIKAISGNGATAATADAAHDGTHGTLRVGDWLLQINGTCVIGFTLKKVIGLLKTQPAVLTLTVVRSKCSDSSYIKELVFTEQNTSLESSSDVRNCYSDDKTEILQENLNEKPRQHCLVPLKNGYRVNSQNTIKDQFDKLKDDLNWLWNIPLVKVPQIVDSKVLLETQLYLLDVLDRKHYINEFQSLKQVKPSNSATKVAHLEENQTKNRFHNIVPYDKCCVVLSGSAKYINASHIDIEVSTSLLLKYIACQTPLRHTISDFWRMVWEKRASMIITMGHEVEFGAKTGFQYWPDSQNKSLNNMTQYHIKILERYSHPHFDIQKLNISDTKERTKHSEIIHLVYRSWPYNINDLHIDSFLQFVQTIQHYRQLSCPLLEDNCSSESVIIHCDSGSTLSAVVIAVDVAVIHIQNNIKFNIFDIVSDLRLQRPQMIETEDQYRICYKASLRAVQKLF